MPDATPHTHRLLSDSPPGREPGAPILETDRLVIRRPLLSDAPAVAAAASFPEVARCMSDIFRYPYRVEDAESWIKSTLPKTDDDDPKSFYPSGCVILIKANSSDNPGPDPQLIGSFGFTPGENIEYIQWSIGYFLTPAAWGKGYATEAFGAVIRWAFATWPKLNRIEGETYSFNKASGGLLRKLGFTQEGIRRGCLEKYGEVMDSIVYGLLRDEVQQ